MTHDRTRAVVLGLTLMASVAACRTAPPAPTPAPIIETIPAPADVPVVRPTLTVAAQLRQLVDSVNAAPMWRNARWGMLVVHADRADTLLAHDADRLFMPASNQKLLTGAIALTTLGEQYRWRTPVLLHGRARGRTWHGDLLLVGSGDPSFSDSLRDGRAANAFAPLVAALRARGITRIAGSLRAGGDALPGSTTGYGWAYDDFDEEYSAPIDELTWNEGELTLRVYAGRRVGAPVRVERAPTRAYPRLRVEATTRDSVRPDTMRASDAPRAPRPAPLRAAYDSLGDVLVVTGTLPLGDSLVTTVSYRHPGDAVLAALHEALAEAGIRVTGARVARADTLRRAPDTLTVLESAPLSAVLRRMQKPSQNQIAELFFRTSGLVATGDGSADSARAHGARTLAAWGVTAADAAYRDGSGLSRHDYVTPRAVVKVLDAMRTSPTFEVYRDALPIAGVDGTIRTRMRDTPAQGNARAKTGTLDKARSLSGYVTTADGQLVMFSLLCNNYTVPTREVERVQDRIVSLLAGSALVTLPPAAPRSRGTP
ncbi:MAG: D-alanyl-D-alanine carboxypeptidase/D-alanyl-D-alanine-endopeptidase [Gemmatimonadetes bacterium]|nr:D-alanyl-D-alanine carboxypeptidase/D-alanyl-D-alanine-endopeptidase [Gemmatimonadota bacterium]